MKTLTKLQIVRMIEDDPEMMGVLRAVASLDLPDWYVCAGFVRNKVWDYIHDNKQRTKPGDIDVMFFDRKDRALAAKAEARLRELNPELDWDVGNQAFSHEENNDRPYSSTEDALSKQPETVTALGVRLQAGKVGLACPHGIDDLVSCTIRPTPIFYEHPDRKQIVVQRLYQKKLFEKWPKLKVII